MRIAATDQTPLADRPTTVAQPVGSFEDILDLSAALRVRQARERAFTFAERGLLALGDTSNAAPAEAATLAIGAAVQSQGAAQPLQPCTAPPPGGQSLAARSATSALGAEPTFAADGVVARAPVGKALSMGAIVAPSQSRAPVQGGEIEVDAGPAQVQAPAEPSSAEGDVKLMVQRTAEGLVVFAVAAITSPEALERLKSRVENLAREHGTTLARLHLNGEPLSPQPSPRRV